MRGWDKDIVNFCTIDECAAKIQSSIIKAYKKSCPRKNRFRGAEYSLLELWTGKFAEIWAKKAWNYRLTDSDAYKNAIKEYTKALRSRKRSSWKDFCGEDDDITISQILHRILSKDDDYKMGDFQLPCRTPSWDPFSSHSINRGLIATSVITEEKIRWDESMDLLPINYLVRAEFFLASYNKELKLWLSHYVKYSRLVWLSAPKACQIWELYSYQSQNVAHMNWQNHSDPSIWHLFSWKRWKGWWIFK
jgi:hypothetical protein